MLHLCLEMLLTYHLTSAQSRFSTPHTIPTHSSQTIHTQTASPTPHVTHSPPSTSIPIDQAPTTNVPQASPTTGVPTNSQTSPPELCPSDQDEYPLKTGSKESRRFTRYNYITIYISKDQIRQKTKITV